LRPKHWDGKVGQEKKTIGGKRENPKNAWEAPRKMKVKIKLVTKGSTYLQKTTHTKFTPKGNIRETRKIRSTDVMGYEVLKCQ